MSTKVAVCISGTHDMSFAIGTLLVNIKQFQNPNDFKLFIYTNKKKKKLEVAAKNLGYDLEVVQYKAPVNWVKLWSSRAVAYFSPMVLAKFEIFSLLRTYPEVVWLDYDILVKSDFLGSLLEGDFDFGFMDSGHPISTAFLRLPDGLNPTIEGMSAGIIVAKDSFPDHSQQNAYLYKNFEKESSNLYFPEQAIFDLMIQNTKFKRKILAQSEYCAPAGDVSTEARILHSWGPEKFWKIGHPAWLSNYQSWLNNGGSKYCPLALWLNLQKRKTKYFFASAIQEISAKTISKVKRNFI